MRSVKMQKSARILFRTLYLARFRTFAVSHFAFYKWPTSVDHRQLNLNYISIHCTYKTLF